MIVSKSFVSRLTGCLLCTLQTWSDDVVRKSGVRYWPDGGEEGGRCPAGCLFINNEPTVWLQAQYNTPLHSVLHLLSFSFLALVLVLYDWWCFSGLQSSHISESILWFRRDYSLQEKIRRIRASQWEGDVSPTLQFLRHLSYNGWFGSERVKLPGSECFNLLELSLTPERAEERVRQSQKNNGKRRDPYSSVIFQESGSEIH